MRKYLLSFFFSLFITLFFTKTIIFAIGPTGTAIPGVHCGNANSTDVLAKACCQSNINISGVGSWDGWLDKIPVLGSMIRDQLGVFTGNINQSQNNSTNIPCLFGYPSNPSGGNNCVCLGYDQITPSPIQAISTMCSRYLIGSSELSACNECARNNGYYSSLACVYGNLSRFITETIFGWAIGLAGLIALFCIIYSAFQLQTSAGNPEKVKKTQELLTSCIMGLMLIIFSVFILRLIGVSILKIPFFS